MIPAKTGEVTAMICLWWAMEHCQRPISQTAFQQSRCLNDISWYGYFNGPQADSQRAKVTKHYSRCAPNASTRPCRIARATSVLMVALLGCWLQRREGCCGKMRRPLMRPPLHKKSQRGCCADRKHFHHCRTS